MAIRAIRGATQVEVDDKEHVLALTRDLVAEVMEVNKLTPDDVISIIFSATGDIASVAPALAARQLGLHDPALLCVQEMHVEGAMPRLVRLIAHVETELTRDQVRNVYQRGTDALRRDVPAVPAVEG
jgi:chorismate mutase